MGYVSLFMENPTKPHLLVVKRVLRYVVGLRIMGVTTRGRRMHN
jgi:hypothetical protein